MKIYKAKQWIRTADAWVKSALVGDKAKVALIIFGVCTRLVLLAGTWGLCIWEARSIIEALGNGSLAAWLGGVCLVHATRDTGHDVRHARHAIKRLLSEFSKPK